MNTNWLHLVIGMGLAVGAAESLAMLGMLERSATLMGGILGGGYFGFWVGKSIGR